MLRGYGEKMLARFGEGFPPNYAIRIEREHGIVADQVLRVKAEEHTQLPRRSESPRSGEQIGEALLKPGSRLLTHLRHYGVRDRE